MKNISDFISWLETYKNHLKIVLSDNLDETTIGVIFGGIETKLKEMETENVPAPEELEFVPFTLDTFPWDALFTGKGSFHLYKAIGAEHSLVEFVGGKLIYFDALLKHYEIYDPKTQQFSPAGTLKTN